MAIEEGRRRARSNTTSGMLMPQVLYSAEAEKAVLGCMMAQPADVIPDACVALIKEDFFVPAHQEIFGAIREMSNTSQAIDVMTIHQWLTDRKLEEAVGSPGILAELLVGFATHLNVGSYIRIVKEKSLLRMLQTACSTIVQDIMDMPDSVAEVVDRAEGSIFAVTQSTTEIGFAEPMSALADAHYETIKNRIARRGLVGLDTGFHRLNELTAGWKPGEMIVLAARPGVGKTALGMKFAANCASGKWEEVNGEDFWTEPGNPVGFFSVEMTNEQLMDRLFAAESKIAMERIRVGVQFERDLNILNDTRIRLRQWPLYIDSSSYLTLNGLRSKARRMKARFNISMLVIDYLQLLSAPGSSKFDNRQNEVATISRGIKALAKELGIPIIILAQLNRKVEEGRKDGEPQLHNLRESGAIEQDADVVILLHRPESLLEDGNEPVVQPVIPYKLIVAKQRNGPCDKIDVMLRAAYTLFEEPIRYQPAGSVAASQPALI